MEDLRPAIRKVNNQAAGKASGKTRQKLAAAREAQLKRSGDKPMNLEQIDTRTRQVLTKELHSNDPKTRLEAARFAAEYTRGRFADKKDVVTEVTFHTVAMPYHDADPEPPKL